MASCENADVGVHSALSAAADAVRAGPNTTGAEELLRKAAEDAAEP